MPDHSLYKSREFSAMQCLSMTSSPAGDQSEAGNHSASNLSLILKSRKGTNISLQGINPAALGGVFFFLVVVCSVYIDVTICFFIWSW